MLFGQVRLNDLELWSLTASATLSSTAPLVKRNKAEVPGVILDRTVDKALIDAIIGKVPHQGAYSGADRQTEERDKEQ